VQYCSCAVTLPDLMRCGIAHPAWIAPTVYARV
jgi:hypothetical protein